MIKQGRLPGGEFIVMARSYGRECPKWAEVDLLFWMVKFYEQMLWKEESHRSGQADSCVNERNRKGEEWGDP